MMNTWRQTADTHEKTGGMVKGITPIIHSYRETKPMTKKIRIKRKITVYTPEELLKLQHKEEKKYGLPQHKTLNMELLISLSQQKKIDIPHREQGGMYQ